MNEPQPEDRASPISTPSCPAAGCGQARSTPLSAIAGPGQRAEEGQPHALLLACLPLPSHPLPASAPPRLAERGYLRAPCFIHRQLQAAARCSPLPACAPCSPGGLGLVATVLPRRSRRGGVPAGARAGALCREDIPRRRMLSLSLQPCERLKNQQDLCQRRNRSWLSQAGQPAFCQGSKILPS